MGKGLQLRVHCYFVLLNQENLWGSCIRSIISNDQKMNEIRIHSILKTASNYQNFLDKFPYLG